MSNPANRVEGPVAGRSGARRPRILLIPFECANWQNAKAWSYTGYYAFEEGLQAAGVEYVTLPAIAGIPSDHPLSWLKYARALCKGEQFDQVWIWITHNEYHPDLFNWLAEIAPVRLGLVMESLEHTASEFACYPKLSGRRERVLTLLSQLTGLLAFDAADAESVGRELPVRTMWCPPIVPERCVCEGVSLPEPGPAVFHGSLYSPERKMFFEHPELQGLLAKPRLPEEDTDWPKEFDRIHVEAMTRLAQQRNATLDHLTQHWCAVRKVRRELFRLWLKGLAAAYMTVNLPSVFKGYAGRVLESMAAGRPVISWNPPGRRTRALFQPDREILLFDHQRPADLKRQIVRLQADPALALRVAQQARAKVLRYHTAEARVRQILGWVEAGTEPDLGEEPEIGRETQSHPQTSRKSSMTPPVDPVVALTNDARLAAQAGQVVDCQSLLQRALQLDPKARDALKLRADVHVRQGRLIEALHDYQQMIEQHPKDAVTLYALAFTLERAGKWDAALAVYSHLRAVVPRDIVLAERVDRLQAEKRGSGAAGPVSPSAVEDPDVTLARRLWREGNKTEAEQAFQAGLAKPPPRDPLRLAYADFLVQENRPIDALGQLHEVVSQNGQHAAAWLMGGTVALSQPDFLEFARDWTLEASRNLPEAAGLTAQRAEALLLSGAVEESLGLWERAWTKDRQPRTFAALVICNLVLGRPLARFTAEKGDSCLASRAFLEWYQKLVAFNAKGIVGSLNVRCGELKAVLPEAAEALEGALAEVASGRSGES